MIDRVYPSAKPNANGAAAAGGNPSFPANKAQLYNASRPAYRPQPPRRSRRSCCCACCLWTTLAVLLVLLLAAVAGAVLWVLYRPHRPNFTLSSLQISQFNLTSSSQLTSKFNLTIVARNPNKKLKFLYDPIGISITASGVPAGDGSIPAFMHFTKNTTTLRTIISSTGKSVNSTQISVLKSDLKNKKSLPLKIQLDTKVRVKIGGFKTKKVGVRVRCDGVNAAVPTGKTPATASTANAKCKVDLRIKIWKWTF